MCTTCPSRIAVLFCCWPSILFKTGSNILQTDDQKVKDQLAYARLIIREAQRHSGSGWLDYDRVFRQQAALDLALKWNSLHPGIQASTLVGQVANAHMLCRLCREPDHSTNQCALWPYKQLRCTWFVIYTAISWEASRLKS